MWKQPAEQLVVFQPWTSPNRPTLEVDTVDIWRATTEVSDRDVEMLLGLLSPAELARVRRFHFNVDRRKFVVARGCLRTLLSHYLGIEPADVSLMYNDFGKPSLANSTNDDDLRFNVAHSGELILYGLTLKRRIGVDVEYVQSKFAVDEIAQRYFSPYEIAKLRELSHVEQNRAFLVAGLVRRR